MSTHRITDGTSQIDISPIDGYNEPENRVRQQLNLEGGLSDVHEWGGKRVYELPLNNVSEANADLLISWWQNMTRLTLTPDLPNAPGSTMEVHITEMDRPLQMWGGDWDTLFNGMITLHEISSISFSSSSDSVSGSKSCSTSLSESVSGNDSRYCSTEVSISGSYSTSYSGSDSLSCSTSVSRSCSDSVSYSNSYSISGGGSVQGSVAGTISSCEDLSSTSCSTSGSQSETSSRGDVEIPVASSCSTSQESSTGTLSSVSCSISGVG